MEAATLQKKKNTINKGKVKKNIKNVLCRPDKVFWPEVTEEEGKRLQIALCKYKTKLPVFSKPHWKELKLIPKEKRPKPPQLKKVEGLIFGISECSTAIQEGQCSAIIIEATVNPRMIVQPVIEMCTSKDIPLLCLTDLRKLALANYGVKTSCLGLKTGHLSDLRDEIVDISNSHPKPISNTCRKPVEKFVKMNEDECQIDKNESMDVTESPYLYRTNKKSRVFVPGAQETTKKTANKFIGQDFIEFSDKVENKSYMKMVLKRISNNPDRVKKK